MFKTLINIDSDLISFFSELENYFSIKLDKIIIEKIFKDAEDDQVSEKDYKIFEKERSLFKSQIQIIGKVDEYEPNDIWIEIKNIKDRDLNHFKNWIEDQKAFR